MEHVFGGTMADEVLRRAASVGGSCADEQYTWSPPNADE